MRVITRRRLREFWEGRKSDETLARRSLLAWERIVRNAEWRSWGELKQTFGTADRVGNCTVFDVGNNNFRLIARVVFDKGRVFVLRVMDHAEYDRTDWAEQCGCHTPKPQPRKKNDGHRPA